MTKECGRLITASVFRLLLGTVVFLLLCPAMVLASGNPSATVAGSFSVPLVIRNISVLDIGKNSVTITWQTNGNATSHVIYDTNPLTSGTHPSADDTSPVSFHTVTLTGLSPSTTYHYRVKSVVPTNSTIVAVSDDDTITTLSTDTNEPSSPATEPESPSDIEVPIDPETSTATDTSGNQVSVTGGNIIIDESGGTPKVKIPVALTEGSTLSYFKDSAGTTFDNNAIVIPMKSVNKNSSVYFTIEDERGDLDTNLTIETGQAIGTGSDAVADVKAVKGAHSAFSVHDLSPDEQTANLPSQERVGKVATAISLDLNTVPKNASVQITTSREPDSTAFSAFQLTASDIGLQSFDIAYSANITKTNLVNGTDIKSATITMKAGADWVISHGGSGSIKIFRFDPQSGQRQALETQFAGYDAEGLAIFEAVSPNGLSVFALVGQPRVNAPFVISILPRDDSQNVATNTAIYVNFSAEMDRSSAQNAFRIWPATSGNFSWDGNTMIFTPDGELNSNTSYSVAISTGAKIPSGEMLADTAISLFRTGLKPDNISPHVIGVLPATGSSEVPVNAAITIYFDEPMNETSVEDSFVITPSARGTFRWQDNSLTFTPTNIMDFETQYSVTITNDATDLVGNPLISEFNLTFHTMPLPPLVSAVLSTSLSSGDTDIEVDSAFSITFSQAMDRNSTERAFSISPDVNGRFAWIDDFTMEFIPNSDLQFDTVYTVTISDAARDSSGNNLYAPYRWNFTTEKQSPATFPMIFGLVPALITALLLLIWVGRRRRKEEEEEDLVLASPTGAISIDENFNFINMDLQDYLQKDPFKRETNEPEDS